MLKDLIGTVNGLIDKMNEDEKKEHQIKQKMTTENILRKSHKPPRSSDQFHKMRL